VGRVVGEIWSETGPHFSAFVVVVPFQEFLRTAALFKIL
jgi:hypothetical protein